MDVLDNLITNGKGSQCCGRIITVSPDSTITHTKLFITNLLK